MRANYLIGILAISWNIAFADPVPFVVSQMAEQYLASQSAALTNQASEKKPFNLFDPFSRPTPSPKDEFASGFFDGFTQPFSVQSSVDGIRKVAFVKGQNYWREHGNQREQIFAGYGYARVEITGIWFYSFERSYFKPDGSATYQWWLRRLEESTSNVSLKFDLFEYRVRVAGFLSPERYFGLRAPYDREFLATSVMLAD